MTKIYNSATGRTARKRKTCRPIGVLTQELREELQTIGRPAIWSTLINLNVDVLKLKH